MLRLLFMTLLACGTLQGADPVADLQLRLRSIIDAAEPSVAAIVVSSNPAYAPLTPAEKAVPGTLGSYVSPARRTDGIVQPERDKLDLADARNAADNTFGSGIVLSRNGMILTSYHLIANARKIYVRFSDNKGSYADIHAADARSDLAVLRLTHEVPDRKPIKYATVRLSDDSEKKATVFRGQFVVALGHPFAASFLDGKASASWGMISNVRRRAPIAGSEESRQGVLHQYGNLLQTDARLNLGASGGALLNLEGELIGLLNATAAVAGSEASGGYAFPMDPLYRRIIERLSEGREIEYGFLGVSQNGMHAGGGLEIAAVSPNTPASACGLLPRDIILKVDSRPIREIEDLYLLVGGSLAGTEVTLDVLRHGRLLKLTPTLAKFAHPHASIASQRPDAVFGLRVDYSSILQQQPQFLGERRVVRNGVIIRELEPGSPAAERLTGFLSGKAMVISAVNGTPVATPAEFYTLAKGAQSIRLTLRLATDPNDPGRNVTLP